MDFSFDLLKVTDDDVICEACWELAMNAVNSNLQQNIASREEQQAISTQRGHTNVCLLCGCSLIKKQSDKILRENPTELQQSIINIIMREREPRQITSSDRVCHTCWLRVTRQALRQNRLDESRPAEAVLQPNEEQKQPLANPQITVSVETANTNPSEIILQDYRRAANTANHCVFASCNYTGP
ncbi:hypothetical protein ACJJTC_009876 [Scirpophaga incertulas]